MSRIAVASILTECNQLGGSPIDMDWFQRYDLHIGKELLEIDSGVVGGALNTLRPAAAEIVPLLSASTCPGGYITQSCYDELRGDLLQRLTGALPVDGVLLLLHGAAAAEEISDVEGDPLPVTGLVRTLAEGRFRYSGGIWDGVEGNMGPCAVVEVGNIQILITTYATYDWADEQFRPLDLDPVAAKFVVVKNPMNYHVAYGEIAMAIYVLDTPGPTPPTLRHCPFEHVERTYFPADEELELTDPVVLRGW